MHGSGESCLWFCLFASTYVVVVVAVFVFFSCLVPDLRSHRGTPIHRADLRLFVPRRWQQGDRNVRQLCVSVRIDIVDCVHGQNGGGAVV